MDQALVFHNPRKGPCPIYIQNDASIGLIKPTQDHIENFGGLVTEDPQKAIILVVINRNTHLGSKLIMDYAGESTGKGVVDQAWVLESIRQGRMLGPPEWGGYALCRHTAQSYFNDPEEDASGIIHLASSATVGARGDHPQSTGHTALQSSRSLGQLLTSRSLTPVSVQESLIVPQRPTSSRRKALTPKISTPLLKSNNMSRHRKTNNRVRLVYTETEQRKAAAHRDSTPPPPAEEDSMPFGNTNKFYFTDAEKAYLQARVERALANGRVSLTLTVADISKEIPWHSATSITQFIGRQEWYKSTRRRRGETARTSKVRLHAGPGAAPHTDNNGQERAQSTSSPTRDDEDRSSGEASSDSHSESGTSEPPPKAPPRHNITQACGRSVYTDTDKEFVVAYLAWAERNSDSIQGSVYSGMNELMPWHSVSSIQAFVSKRPNLFGKRNIPSRPSKRPLGRAGLEYRLQQGKNTVDTSSSKRRLLDATDSQKSTRSGMV